MQTEINDAHSAQVVNSAATASFQDRRCAIGSLQWHACNELGLAGACMDGAAVVNLKRPSAPRRLACHSVHAHTTAIHHSPPLPIGCI